MQISARCIQRSRHNENVIKDGRKDLLDIIMTDGLRKDRVAWKGKTHVANPDNVSNEL